MALYGVWVDDPRNLVIKPRYWDELREFGFHTAAIMLDTTEPGWDPQYTPGQIRQCFNLARDRDVEVVLTVWPLPQPAQLDAMFDALCSDNGYLNQGVVGLEVDCEGLWNAAHVSGFKDLRAASAYLVQRLDRVRDEFDVRTELTTFAGHPEAKAGCFVTHHVNRVLAQIYATRKNWRKEEVAWDSKYGPGIRQRNELAKFKLIPADEDGIPPKICVGMAAWDQKWPGHEVSEAMDLSLQAALEWNPEEIRLWSSKWIWGVQSDGSQAKKVTEWVRNSIPSR